MSSSPRVLIIGAGLAGPAMAIALARQSIRSTVYERRPVAQGIGGVLMLAQNAVRVLDKVLGVEPDIRELGYSYNGIELQAGSGPGPMQLLGKFGTTPDQRGITIKRPVLHAKLLELCAEYKEFIQVEFGKALVEIQEDEHEVRAVFEDGTTGRGDILLGVDGIHSRVRRHVLGDRADAFSANYCGHVVLGSAIHRSQCDFTGIAPPAFLYTQAGTILTFPTDPSGDSLQWAAFLTTPERDRKAWDEYRTSGQALADLRHEWKDVTAEPIKSMMDNLTPDNVMLWAPYATPDLPTWHTQRVCLLGDAAHAISPSAGQGTAQALEDVGLMARLLGSKSAVAKGYPAIFEHYERVRRKRLEEIRRISDNSVRSRAATPSYAMWWFKKLGLRLGLSALSALSGYLRGPSFLTYDVTKENIEV